MTRRKRNRKSPSRPAAKTASPTTGRLPFVRGTDRVRPWLLAAATALFVARPLFPSEGAAVAGDGQIMVMLWVLLAVGWLSNGCWFLLTHKDAESPTTSQGSNPAGAELIGGPGFWLRFGWVDGAIAVWIGWHTLAALNAVYGGNPRPAVNMLWEWIALGIGFFLIRQLFVGRRELRALVAVMISLAVAASSYGLYQYFYEMPATRAFYQEDPQKALAEAGMDLPPHSPQRLLFEQRLESTEPIGTFALTNSLAGFLAPWLVVAWGIGFFSILGMRSKRLATTVAVAGVSLPLAACLLLTKSRSAYLAVLAGLAMLAVAWWVQRRREKIRFDWKLPAAVLLGGTIVTAGVAGAVAIGGLDAKVLSESSKSLGYRIQYWQAAVRIIGEQPWLGCGPGQFQDAYTRYKLPEASEEVADPHNFILEVWATSGTVALLALLATLGWLAWSLVRSPRAKNIRPTCSQARQSVVFQGSCPRSGDRSYRVDASRFVLAGAAAGFLLSLPIGWMSSAPPGLAAVGWGLPTAALSVGLFRPWVNRGRLPKLIPAVGVLALLINLLFAGGIGFPAVAGTFWLLAAVMLNTVDDGPLHLLRRPAATIALATVLVMALACYQTAYRPVLKSLGAMRAARQDPLHAEQHLREAAQADPLSSGPWKQRAALVLERIERAATAKMLEEALDEFETCRRTALELAPRSASSWAYFADFYARIYRKTKNEQHLRQAIWAYRKVVQLYPNDCGYRALLAEVLFELGDVNASDRQARKALELNHITPHIDKKLPDEQRERLLRIIGGSR